MLAAPRGDWPIRPPKFGLGRSPNSENKIVKNCSRLKFAESSITQPRIVELLKFGTWCNGSAEVAKWL